MIYYLIALLLVSNTVLADEDATIRVRWLPPVYTEPQYEYRVYVCIGECTQDDWWVVQQDLDDQPVRFPHSTSCVETPCIGYYQTRLYTGMTLSLALTTYDPTSELESVRSNPVVLGQPVTIGSPVLDSVTHE